MSLLGKTVSPGEDATSWDAVLPGTGRWLPVPGSPTCVHVSMFLCSQDLKGLRAIRLRCWEVKSLWLAVTFPVEKGLFPPVSDHSCHPCQEALSLLAKPYPRLQILLAARVAAMVKITAEDATLRVTHQLF